MERQLGKVQLWRRISGQPAEKEAELSNTYDMPAQGPARVPPQGGQRKAVIRKTAARLEPYVDVSQEPLPRVFQEKCAQYYALPDAGMYPLDSYVQVKQAAQYFSENKKVMPPEDRHMFCTNLVKRAAALNISVEPVIEKYGSEKYASEAEIEVGLFARRTALLDEDQIGLLDKLAAVRAVVEPEIFAAALARFDEGTGLAVHYDAAVPDAYYTTFGKTARALTEPTDPAASVVIGNEYITRSRLADYLSNNVSELVDRFGSDLANELASRPNEIFDSLPRDQKLILMRMANTSNAPAMWSAR